MREEVDSLVQGAGPERRATRGSATYRSGLRTFGPLAQTSSWLALCFSMFARMAAVSTCSGVNSAEKARYPAALYRRHMLNRGARNS